MLKDSKTDMGFLTIFSKTYPSLLTFNQGIFLKSTRPSLPLKKAPPLTPGARVETALPGARDRYALRLADHQRSAQVLRDGTALRYRYLYRSTAPFGIFIVNSIPTLPSFTTCLF